MAKRQQPAGSRQPTMGDVAELAKVSQMTVSRVMRKKGYVSNDIVERVHAASSQLGYVHNRIAGGLAGEKNALVGVILPTLRNRVFTEVLSGITEALAASDIQPVFGVSEYSLELEAKLVEDLLSWRPMGLILAGLEHAPSVRKMIESSGIRSVEVMDTDGEPISACFGFSQHDAGVAMAEHLLAKGYRKFAHIGCQMDLDIRAAKRRNGFVETVEKHGGTLSAQLLSDEPSSMVAGRTLTKTILSGGDPIDVIYYGNDDLASGGLMHCIAENVSVPNDVALAGFNGLSFLQSMPLEVTTSRSPRFEIGFEAGLYVSGARDDSETSQLIVDMGTTIVPGQTS